ncbi:outer membrane lipoprotein carrier protein LolA [Thiomonas sp. FB-6]|uniref:outer membrane lipoprotein carrier protein LolA n=1 Tax=Thiomonas sp. FB-6 TaxID=1158291 RepID=UPI00036D8F54|nr:outer membrane lipoprotein carrier protein LolA [Thiomonas sp. FB-6]
MTRPVRFGCAAAQGGPPARGRRRRVLAALVLALGAGPAFAAASGAAPWDLAALMAMLGARKSGEARFQETRNLAMLDAPIESSGILRFAAPDMLEMHTLRPAEQRLVVRGRQLSVEIGGRTQHFDLDETPAVGALVEGLRATLGGDLAGLQRAYRTRLEGGRRRWTLVLVPRLPAARARVSEIDLSGSEASVQGIAVFQADGDRSWMRIQELRQP